MANHAYVETQRDMTPQGIMSLFEELNSSLFHGKLTVQFTADNAGNHPVGPVDFPFQTRPKADSGALVCYRVIYV